MGHSQISGDQGPSALLSLSSSAPSPKLLKRISFPSQQKITGLKSIFLSAYIKTAVLNLNSPYTCSATIITITQSMAQSTGTRDLPCRMLCICSMVCGITQACYLPSKPRYTSFWSQTRKLTKFQQNLANLKPSYIVTLSSLLLPKNKCLYCPVSFLKSLTGDHRMEASLLRLCLFASISRN